MKERPILFSAPMVRAILEGRKTMTRRVVKMDADIQSRAIRFVGNQFGQWCYIDKMFPSGGVKYPFALSSPYGKAGDRLWVRESFAPRYFDGGKTAYKADWSEAAADVVPEPKWKPSIHMPRAMSRITLEITGVRVERLQDIRDSDCFDEGWEPEPIAQRIEAYLARNWFSSLWEKINGKKYPWDSNPWVWVVEFKQADPT